MREYYFNDGVYQRTFSSERAAHSAALRLANTTGKSVRVMYRNVGVAPKRLATMRVRKNPVVYRGKYPRNIRAVGGSKGVYHATTNDGMIYRIYPGPSRALPKLGTDIRDYDGEVILDHHSRTRTYKKNPATYGRSIMGHKHRALNYRAAIRSMLAKARKLQAEPVAATSRRGITTVHTVELKIGPKSVVESFTTKAQANQWAKDARKQGFEVHVY